MKTVAARPWFYILCKPVCTHGARQCCQEVLQSKCKFLDNGLARTFFWPTNLLALPSLSIRHLNQQLVDQQIPEESDLSLHDQEILQLHILRVRL